MIPRELLATAEVPGGDEPLRLIRRGSEYSIMLGANELMNSRLSGSEEAMSTLAAARIAGVSAPRVLIGGLGMGFTLRTALQAFGARASIEVAELVPEIVDWARGPMAHLHAGTLDDPRVSIHVGDVGGLIRSSAGRFDAILLDVDNGPDGLVRPENNRLYGKAGLHNARKALAPGGVLAIWSAERDDKFVRRMESVGFNVEEVEVRARYDADGKGKGPRHVIWFATYAG